MFESLVKVIEETGQSFKPDLAEEDKLKVENQMKTANALETYLKRTFRLSICISAHVTVSIDNNENKLRSLFQTSCMFDINVHVTCTCVQCRVYESCEESSSLNNILYFGVVLSSFVCYITNFLLKSVKT